MAEKEQVKPLASFRRSDEEEPAPFELIDPRNAKYILCFGFLLASLLILVTTVLVLLFTVWHIKNPVIATNSFRLQGFHLLNTTTLDSNLNMTLSAKLSVKNPNAASFKFDDTTTSVYYGGVLVGESTSTTSLGKVKARRTIGVDVAVDIVDQIMVAASSLSGDLMAGSLTLNSRTRVAGKVKMLNRNKHVEKNMNCTLIYKIASQAIEQERCTH